MKVYWSVLGRVLIFFFRLFRTLVSSECCTLSVLSIIFALLQRWQINLNLITIGEANIRHKPTKFQKCFSRSSCRRGWQTLNTGTYTYAKLRHRCVRWCMVAEAHKNHYIACKLSSNELLPVHFQVCLMAVLYQCSVYFRDRGAHERRRKQMKEHNELELALERVDEVQEPVG